MFDAFFPRTCVVCEVEGSRLCLSCLADLSLDGPPFAYANSVIRQLICAWKYDGDADAFSALHRIIVPRLGLLRAMIGAKKSIAIVPVPLSPWKERWRGFSQSRDLARMLGKEVQLPVLDVVQRAHRFRAQANLSHAVRRTALKKNPFFVKTGAHIPESLVLVDDVETTGATMDAVEEVLLAAGAKTVIRWSLAKG